MKEVRVTVDAKKVVLVDIDQLCEFQGNLKDLSVERYDKLKKQILKHGFSFMPHVWANEKKLYILDGHQRKRTLTKMREEGYKIPKIPVAPVMAPSFKEAKEIVLSGTSQFGEITDQGLYEFIAESGLDWRDVVRETQFPEIDFVDFVESHYGEITSGSKAYNEPTGVSLADKFLVPPFSILDARQGYWQERKSRWMDEIGDEGESRKGTLAFPKNMSIKNNVSILDPVLAEAMVKWFTPAAGSLCLDPFAGDTVFGYVAKKMGHRFTGIELRPDQAKINQARCDRLTEGGGAAVYHCDTSENIDRYVKNETQDFLFSCPPYFDLEVYSDDPKDLSTLGTYKEFRELISAILFKSVRKLKPDSFACIVIGEVRCKKTGYYHGLVPDMITAMSAAGANLYNEIILATSLGNAGIRAARYMNSRKVAKIHQNVLVFYKGNPKNVSKKFPVIELPPDLAAEGSDDATLSGQDSHT